MIPLEGTAAVLLCAGQARRFGGDKLMHPWRGHPLVAHAVSALSALPLAARLAVVRPDDAPLQALLTEAGFALVMTDAADDAQAVSLGHGLAAALALTPDGILLALGDMPCVTPAHLDTLAGTADADTPALSAAPDGAGPPWIASAHWVTAHQAALKPALFAAARRVSASAEVLRDMDVAADFARTERV